MNRLLSRAQRRARGLLVRAGVLAAVLAAVALVLFSPRPPAASSAPAPAVPPAAASSSTSPSAAPAPEVHRVLLVDVKHELAALVIDGHQVQTMTVGLGAGVDGTQHGTVTDEWPMSSKAPCFPGAYARTDGDLAIEGLTAGCTPWPWTIAMDPTVATQILTGGKGIVVQFGEVVKASTA